MAKNNRISTKGVVSAIKVTPWYKKKLVIVMISSILGVGICGSIITMPIATLLPKLDTSVDAGPIVPNPEPPVNSLQVLKDSIIQFNLRPLNQKISSYNSIVTPAFQNQVYQAWNSSYNAGNITQSPLYRFLTTNVQPIANNFILDLSTTFVQNYQNNADNFVNTDRFLKINSTNPFVETIYSRPVSNKTKYYYYYDLFQTAFFVDLSIVLDVNNIPYIQMRYGGITIENDAERIALGLTDSDSANFTALKMYYKNDIIINDSLTDNLLSSSIKKNMLFI